MSLCISSDFNPYSVDRNILLRAMKPSDRAGVTAVYKEGLATGNATFQQQMMAVGNLPDDSCVQCREARGNVL